MIEAALLDPRWYDVEWVECVRCDGTGEYVECYDDLCHARDWCMHGDNACVLCVGMGYISIELADRWLERRLGEAVKAPDADLHERGLLQQVARERHGRVVEEDGEWS